MKFYFLRFIDAIDFNVGISIGQTSTQDNALEQLFEKCFVYAFFIGSSIVLLLVEIK